MYGREYQGKKLNFEASGGLVHSSLVMQDRETDTYWAIMSGTAIRGKLTGTKLEELPVGEKMQWKDWVKKHPDTQVLSVGGLEDLQRNPYAGYFRSSQGFRGERARDKRLKTKEPIFSFHLQGESYAVAHKIVEGGKSFVLGSLKLFFYRPRKADMFQSTAAFISKNKGFEFQNGSWVDLDSGCKFNPDTGAFEGEAATCAERIPGFDTFWYNWSLANPDTKLLSD